MTFLIFVKFGSSILHANEEMTEERNEETAIFKPYISRVWQINFPSDFNLANRFSSRNALPAQGLSCKHFHYILDNFLAFLKTIQCRVFINSNFVFRMFNYLVILPFMSSSCLTGLIRLFD